MAAARDFLRPFRSIREPANYGATYYIPCTEIAGSRGMRGRVSGHDRSPMIAALSPRSGFAPFLARPTSPARLSRNFAIDREPGITCVLSSVFSALRSSVFGTQPRRVTLEGWLAGASEYVARREEKFIRSGPGCTLRQWFAKNALEWSLEWRVRWNL